MSLLQIGGGVAAAVLLVAVAANSERRMAPPMPVYETPAYAKALDAELAAPRPPPGIAEGGGVRLRSVRVELPASDAAFPPGPGAELVANNCQACHTAGMILNQPQLTRAEWTGEVTKMVRTYKAPISDEDAAGIVTYLAGLKIDT